MNITNERYKQSGSRDRLCIFECHVTDQVYLVDCFTTATEPRRCANLRKVDEAWMTRVCTFFTVLCRTPTLCKVKSMRSMRMLSCISTSARTPFSLRATQQKGVNLGSRRLMHRFEHAADDTCHQSGVKHMCGMANGRCASHWYAIQPWTAVTDDCCALKKS